VCSRFRRRCSPCSRNLRPEAPSAGFGRREHLLTANSDAVGDCFFHEAAAAGHPLSGRHRQVPPAQCESAPPSPLARESSRQAGIRLARGNASSVS
jgi:hypothetical protein